MVRYMRLDVVKPCPSSCVLASLLPGLGVMYRGGGTIANN